MLLPGKYFDYWYLVLILTEGSCWLVLLNENGVVIPLITEFDEPFSGVDGAFK